MSDELPAAYSSSACLKLRKSNDICQGNSTCLSGREQLADASSGSTREHTSLATGAMASAVGYDSRTPVAEAGLLEQMNDDTSTRAEACLCDADLGGRPTADREEAREDISAALVDRFDRPPAAAAISRRSSSRTASFLSRADGGGGGLASSPVPGQPSPSARPQGPFGLGLQQSRRRYQSQMLQLQVLAQQQKQLQQQQLQMLQWAGQGRESGVGRERPQQAGVRLDEQPTASLQEVPRSYDVTYDVTGPASGPVSAGEHSHHGLHAWMDAGSVWSSVQRHGEELQRRQRTGAAAAGAAAPLQRRVSIVGAAGAAASAWWRGPLKRFMQRVRTQAVLTARVAAKDPYTVVVPVVLLVCLLGLGLWGTFSVAYTIRDGRRQAALNAATDYSNTLKSHIAATMAPAYTVKTLIEIQPLWWDINKTFHERAPDLVRKGLESDAILTIVLAPQGIASAIVPTGLPAWDKVYGLDLLREPAWRRDALKTVQLHKEGMVMTGPSVLRAGMMGIVTRYAVFVPGGPNESFGFKGAAFNCSFCFERGTGPKGQDMRFWGFAQLNVDWNVLVHNVTRMHELCDRDHLKLRMSYINPVNGSNLTVAGCGDGHLGAEPVVVEIKTMQNSWTLAVTDSRGWMPDWLPVVVSVVVLLSLWVSIAMAVILINRREHMWLLQAMLPKKVIATLRRGEEYAEAFECVTVLFSDIVSYTTLASEMEPIKVVRLLNEMYSEFDALVDQFECYKVETIGDAFMAVCGTQGEAAVAAAVKMARLAQAMIERTHVLVSADGQKIQIRIGLHSGPVVGAVVGFKMPHFCLCGDTVNTASRMESNSRPMRIHISDTTAALLAASGEGFRLERRGLIQVKGKGPMLTHWLLTADDGCRSGSGGGGGGGGGEVLALPPGEADAKEGSGAAAAGTETRERGVGHQADGAAASATATAELPPPLDAAEVAAAELAEVDAAAATAEEGPWRGSSAALATMPILLGMTPFASAVTLAGGSNAGGGAAAAGSSPCSSLAATPGHGRRRFSEIGAFSGGGGGGVSSCSRGIPYLPGLNGIGGGHGVVSSSGAVTEDGNGGGGAVTMSCSGSGVAPRKPRTSVDLRLFQTTNRRARGK